MAHFGNAGVSPDGTVAYATVTFEGKSDADFNATKTEDVLNIIKAQDGKDGLQIGANGVFGFVGGDEARQFMGMTGSQRRAAVLGNFTHYFGPKARQAREYLEANWTREVWTRGCPVAVPGPGILVAYGDLLRKPVGLIHWAGTETSTY